MLGVLLLAGCNPAYLVQAAAGQWQLVSERRPVAAVLADPATDAETRRRLSEMTAALEFAHATLGLPDNGSYRDYADIGRPYVVWNVFAAPRFDLALRRWCFPVAGCVVYRGYFNEGRAHAFAANLAEAGDDVHVAGAAAYSTLGYLRDPLPSSVLRLSDMSVAAMIFHELAHQRLYVPGDTVFNEGFATLVEQEGMVRWLAERGEQAALCRFETGLERARRVHSLIDGTRTTLAGIYASEAPPQARAAAKVAEIDRLVGRYRALRAGWTDPPYFDHWFEDGINNASLGALAAYDQLVGTLRVILESEGGDLPAFYRRIDRLARLDADGRAEVLGAITGPSERGPGAACRARP
ncbi:MAG: aminopeptidase [Gammaproteobacteria bacterium]|nr:aminopeptidase [Gammaproteobacteria bacterium]